MENHHTAERGVVRVRFFLLLRVVISFFLLPVAIMEAISIMETLVSRTVLGTFLVTATSSTRGIALNAIVLVDVVGWKITKQQSWGW